MTDDRDSALVLFSGGQDSAICLAWALARWPRVETAGFDYGQRHRAELDCRAALRDGIVACDPAWAARLGPDHTLDLGVLGEISDTALTRAVAIESAENGLPTTFVPGRNLMFLVLAAALGWRRGLRHLVGGMCETDYSGYPDCRDDALKAMQVALNLGMDRRFVVHTPLMWRDKADTWALAEELGGPALVEVIRDRSLSCYLGALEPVHDWGRGCGECPACRLRARGYARYMARAGP